jgi:hypothetical protein
VGFPWQDGEELPELFRPVGCAACSKTGYKGRLALHEVMAVDEDIERLTVERASSLVIAKHAISKGMITLAWTASPRSSGARPRSRRSSASSPDDGAERLKGVRQGADAWQDDRTGWSGCGGGRHVNAQQPAPGGMDGFFAPSGGAPSPLDAEWKPVPSQTAAERYAGTSTMSFGSAPAAPPAPAAAPPLAPAPRPRPSRRRSPLRR